MLERIKKIIKQGESNKVEFKEATFEIPKSIYETVCAFLNANGGEILLGVKDNGNIEGVAKDSVKQLKENFLTTINSANKINPNVYLDINDIEINNKVILYIQIFGSSQVHRCNGRIYIRKESLDIDITNNNAEVTILYKTKDTSYSENKIFPAVTLDQLRIDLLERVKKIVLLQNANHIWKEMDNISILKHSSLYIKDPVTNEEGFNLACILLLGTDELIATAVPAFRIDLIKRVDNVDRYDDRVDLRTNLIESYEKIIEFIQKHLPDHFYLEGTTRISLRDIIFREIVANILVHKEYSGAEPTRLIIYGDKITTENSNKPYINGIINLNNLMPHPKNPNIAKFFRLLGRVEELGSGIQKLYRYCKDYTGFDPVIKDENIFQIILEHNLFVPKKIKYGKDLTPHVTPHDMAKDSDHDSAHDSAHDSDHVGMSDVSKKIITYCSTPKTLVEIMNFVKFKNKTYFRNKILKPLINKQFIQLTIPDKPKSKLQKYVITRKYEGRNGN